MNTGSGIKTDDIDNPNEYDGEGSKMNFIENSIIRYQ